MLSKILLFGFVQAHIHFGLSKQTYFGFLGHKTLQGWCLKTVMRFPQMEDVGVNSDTAASIRQ